MFTVWVSICCLTARVVVPRLPFRGRAGWFVVALVGTTVAVPGTYQHQHRGGAEVAERCPAAPNPGAAAGRLRAVPAGPVRNQGSPFRQAPFEAIVWDIIIWQ